MSDHRLWLSQAQFARLKPLLPNKPRGAARVDDPLPGRRCAATLRGGRVISGIIHVIRSGLMWRDAPAVFGPPKTLYNRFIRWSRIGVFNRIFAVQAGESMSTDIVMIDRAYLKAHRTAASLVKRGCSRPVSDGPTAA
jgi:putative transposase